MDKHFQVVGHRGACAYAPENTLPSFNLAVKIGVDSIETDIRTTSDGVLVLFHDDRLDRKSNGMGRVEEHTYQQLKQMDFGSWFSPEFAGESIVTLEQLLQHFGNKIHLNLEIKSEGIERRIHEQISASGLKRENYVITAFQREALLEMRKFDPNVTTGWLSSEFSRSTIDYCVYNGIAHICPAAEDLDSELVDYAHSKGLFVRAWGVGNIDLMKKTVIEGADGTTCDFPDKLMEYLARNNSAG